ncbi:MAG TPA: cation:proton antiporter [Vicinamibacteria bacterium]|nr:cation:proton antiporter [Vicinamibacteria bacterium]
MEQATTLVLMASAAFCLPLLSTRLFVPAVVLELLFGILIGPVTGWVSGTELVDLLAELGLFLLMFLAGFEIDFRALEQQGHTRLAMLLVVFLLTLGVAQWCTIHLGLDAFMTLVLATTSVGLVVPTLRSTRRTFTRLGQYILVSAVFADFLTLVLVAMFALVERHGFGIELLKMPTLFIAITFVLRTLRLAVWWYPHRFRRLFSADDPEELGIRASLALMLAFVGLSTALDVEPILGAFLAGTVFALVFRNPGHLQEQLSGFSYGFLIPIFFINVGLRFEITLLESAQVLTRALVVILVAFGVKILPSLVFMVRGLSFREAFAAGVLLSARLSLIIAVATVGVELGLLSLEDRAIAILLAAVTATSAPTLFRALAPPLPPRTTADAAG